MNHQSLLQFAFFAVVSIGVMNTICKTRKTAFSRIIWNWISTFIFIGCVLYWYFYL